MKISIKKENWPILLYIALFVLGRYVWGYFEPRNVALASDGVSVLRVQHTFWYDLWEVQFPDGKIAQDVRMHWYFLPALLTLGSLFTFKRK